MRERELTIVCSRCAYPIADGGGTLWVDMGEVNEYERLIREWKARRAETAAHGVEMYSADDLFSHPEAVQWKAHHTVCDPALHAGAYGIEVHRMRT